MSSQVTFAKLQEAVAYELGWDRTTANWSTDRNNLFETIKKDGLSQFENAFSWSFMRPFAVLQLSQSYATGTIAIASGVVTLTSGTFPSWAAQGDIWVTDEGYTQRYSVNTRDSNTQVTLNDLTVNVTAGASYTLRRAAYDLPSDFGGMLSNGFAFRRDSIAAGRVIKQVGPHELRHFDRDYTDGIPQVFSLEPIAVTTSASTTWKASFAPMPDEDYFLDYQYQVVAADVTSGGSYPYGGAVHSETIIASVVDAAWRRVRGSNERHPAYLEKLEISKRYDLNNFKVSDYGVGRYGERRGLGLHCGRTSIDDATFSFS